MGLVRCIAVRLGLLHNWNCRFPELLEDGSTRAGEPWTEWVGLYGEMAAESFLLSSGYHILRRNWKERNSGEIDLVCRDRDTLVFVEVKTRTVEGQWEARRAVNKEKRNLIRSGARTWLRMLKNDDVVHRYDIVEVYLTDGEKPKIYLLQAAFGDREHFTPSF